MLYDLPLETRLEDRAGDYSSQRPLNDLATNGTDGRPRWIFLLPFLPHFCPHCRSGLPYTIRTNDPGEDRHSAYLPSLTFPSVLQVKMRKLVILAKAVRCMNLWCRQRWRRG
jgi:hypothetical protein